MKKMITRLSFTDFDGKAFMDKVDSNIDINEEIIHKLAPRVVEGVKGLNLGQIVKN